jgi:putative acyl-CoA dehydrogenase
VLERSPETVRQVLEEIDELAGREPRVKVALDHIESLLGEAMRDQSVARALVEQLALAQAAALLLAHGPQEVSDAFLATRLGAWRSTYGAAATGGDTRAILDRALP